VQTGVVFLKDEASELSSPFEMREPLQVGGLRTPNEVPAEGPYKGIAAGTVAGPLDMMKEIRRSIAR